MSLTSATGGAGGGGAGTERAPRLEGNGDYPNWRVRMDAHLQARGAQNAHVRSLTETDFRARRAAVDAWDVEDDERAFGAGALDDGPELGGKVATAMPSSFKKEARSGAEPEATARTQEQRRHARALMARSDMAYGTLLSALPEALQQQTQHTIVRGHAYGLWSWLEAKFQNTERDNVGALWQQWTALQQEADEPFDGYRTRVANTLALLTRAKQHVSTEQQLFALTDRLRPEYKAATLALKNGALIKDVAAVERTIKIYEAPYDFGAIAAFLNAHERAEMRADGATNEQMAAAAMGGRRTGYGRRDDENDEREPPWMTEPCWTCDKVGHPARRCPNRGGRNARSHGRDDRRKGGTAGRGRGDDDDSEGEIISVVATVGSLPDGDGNRAADYDSGDESEETDEKQGEQAVFAVAAAQAQPKQGRARQGLAPSRTGTTAWHQLKSATKAQHAQPQHRTARPNEKHARTGAGKHELQRGTGPTLAIDTMCTMHCTNDKGLLTGPLLSVPPVRVTVANGESIEVSLVGTLNLTVMAKKSGELRKKNISIKDVYFHPSFTTTLISWGKLRQQGWQLGSKESGSVMETHNGWRIPLCNYGKLLVLATDRREQSTPVEPVSGAASVVRAPVPKAGGASRSTPDNDGWTQVKSRRKNGARKNARYGAHDAGADRKQRRC